LTREIVSILPGCPFTLYSCRINKYQELAVKKYLTFQNLPMVLVMGLIAWAWLSLFSVLIAGFF
jgi:hypothetical protein